MPWCDVVGEDGEVVGETPMSPVANEFKPFEVYGMRGLREFTETYEALVEKANSEVAGGADD